MSEAELSPEVQEAIVELETAFPDQVSYVPDGSGGADVTVAQIELGPGWEPERADLSFNLAYNYPFTPVYPYYLPEGTAPRGNSPQALQNISRNGMNVVQVSLRINQWDPNRDSALGCVYQTRAWAREQR